MRSALIVTETNCFAVAEVGTTPSAREWFDTTVEEMKAFIGILILMGIQKLPRLEMYWSTHYSVIHTPGIADIMPRVRFEQLFRCLQMCSSSQSIPVGQPGTIICSRSGSC